MFYCNVSVKRCCSVAEPGYCKGWGAVQWTWTKLIEGVFYFQYTGADLGFPRERGFAPWICHCCCQVTGRLGCVNHPQVTLPVQLLWYKSERHPCCVEVVASFFSCPRYKSGCQVQQQLAIACWRQTNQPKTAGRS